MKENDPVKFMSDDMRDGFGIDKAHAEASGSKDYEAVKGGAAVSPAPVGKVAK